MIMDKERTVSAILGSGGRSEKRKGEELEDKPEMDSIRVIAEEVMECIHNKDVDGMLEGLRALFDEFDSLPHHEGPHI